MIFRRELAEKVMAGEKTVTRRPCSDNPKSPWWRERCSYKVGKRFAVNPGRGVPRIGEARVLSVRREPLVLVLGEYEPLREGFSSREDLMKTWRELHGDFDPDLLVWRIEFELVLA